jgi:anthranilate/para-aminobenzoate synthase component II
VAVPARSEVLVVDNYDSFVHNLVQYLGELGASPRVARNDAPGLLATVDAFDGPILLSPGPGHPAEAVFAGIPSPVEATRYHSLAVDPDSLPPDLRVSARTDDGVVMGIRHVGAAAEGVQFHPESILTRHGHDMLRNFLAGAGVTASPPPPVPR